MEYVMDHLFGLFDRIGLPCDLDLELFVGCIGALGWGLLDVDLHLQLVFDLPYDLALLAYKIRESCGMHFKNILREVIEGEGRVALLNELIDGGDGVVDLRATAHNREDAALNV